jgi:hypothetical protein
VKNKIALGQGKEKLINIAMMMMMMMMMVVVVSNI